MLHNADNFIFYHSCLSDENFISCFFLLPLSQNGSVKKYFRRNVSLSLVNHLMNMKIKDKHMSDFP